MALLTQEWSVPSRYAFAPIAALLVSQSARLIERDLVILLIDVFSYPVTCTFDRADGGSQLVYS